MKQGGRFGAPVRLQEPAPWKDQGIYLARRVRHASLSAVRLLSLPTLCGFRCNDPARARGDRSEPDGGKDTLQLGEGAFFRWGGGTTSLSYGKCG